MEKIDVSNIELLDWLHEHLPKTTFNIKFSDISMDVKYAWNQNVYGSSMG